MSKPTAQTAPSASTAISTLTETSSLPQLSSELNELMGGVGTGFENVRQQDVLIPRLTILQGLSPQVIPSKSQYDKEARVGDIYDTGMSQIFKSVHILPLHFVVQWLEWAPRSSTKGLIAIHDEPPAKDKYVINEKGQMITKEGNLIQETAQIYCLNLDANGRPCFIPFSSTQLKKARKLMTYATNERVMSNGVEQTPPLFFRSYLLDVVPESNANGDWMGWKVTPDKRLDELESWQVRLKAVKEFRARIIAGEVRGDIEREDVEEARSTATNDDSKAM